MKYKGRTVDRPTQVFTLECGETVTVAAPRLGAVRKALTVVPNPAPPQRHVKSKAGVQLITNLEDPAYQAKLVEARVLQGVYLFWEATRGVGEFEFETKLADNEEPSADFVEKLAEEIDASFITGADLKKIVSFVHETAGFTDDEVDAASDFSDGPAG